MKVHTLERRQHIPRPIDDVFSFFADAHNLDFLTPPWLRFRILSPMPIAMVEGALIDYRIRWRGMPVRWSTRIEEWMPGMRFVDRQIRGPYRLWHHTHLFERDGTGTAVTDVVRYSLPLGPIGSILHRAVVRGDLELIFDYRAQRIDERFRGVRANDARDGCRKAERVANY